MQRKEFLRSLGTETAFDPVALYAAGFSKDVVDPIGYFPLIVMPSYDQQILGEAGYRKMSPEARVSLLKSFLI